MYSEEERSSQSNRYLNPNTGSADLETQRAKKRRGLCSLRGIPFERAMRAANDAAAAS